MALTIQEATLVARYASTRGVRARVLICNQAREMLKAEAERLLAREVESLRPVVITDIQVYSDTTKGSWVKYVYSDGYVRKLLMRDEAAGAINMAWEAGKRVGSGQSKTE